MKNLILLLIICVPFIAFSQQKIKMKKSGGIWMVPGKLNGLSFDFVFDTGAADVFISSDIFSVMVKQGTITENDILDIQTYKDASGNYNEAIVFNIREIIIGGFKVTNVKGSVSNSNQTPLLLGQTFLESFPSFTQTKDGYLILNDNNSSDKNNFIKKSKTPNPKNRNYVFSYTINNNSPYNLSIYLNRINKDGFYFGFEIMPNMYVGEYASIYEVRDNTVQMYDGGALIGTFGPTIEKSSSNMAFDVGITKMILYPLWLSGGVGINYLGVDEKRAHYYDFDNSGIIYEDQFWGYVWMDNKDESSWNPYVETELHLKILNRIVVRSGIIYNGNIQLQFGVGYAL